MRKHWKCGKIEITICGAVAVVKIFNVTFRKVGAVWELTNVTEEEEGG